MLRSDIVCISTSSGLVPALHALELPAVHRHTRPFVVRTTLIAIRVMTVNIVQMDPL